MKLVRRNRYKRSANISILNLIDVIFVLLLFFMVTTTFDKFAHIDITLPQTSSNFSDSKSEDVELFYLITGELILKTGEQELNFKLSNLTQEMLKLSDLQRKKIVLNADEAISYGMVIEVISALKDADVEHVELNIKKKN